MPDLTERDMIRLATCDVRWHLVTKAAKKTPMMVTWGWRGEEDQNNAYDTKASELRWPDSKHNHMIDGEPCSLAVDLVPFKKGWPIMWKRIKRWRIMASYVWVEAQKAKVSIRWGGIWGDFSHFEIINPRMNDS